MANEWIRLWAIEQLMGTSSSRPPLYNLHNPLTQHGGTCIQFSSLLNEPSCINTVLWRQFSVSPDGERPGEGLPWLLQLGSMPQALGLLCFSFRQAWQATSSLSLILKALMAENMQPSSSANTNWARVESVVFELRPKTVPQLSGTCWVGCWTLLV